MYAVIKTGGKQYRVAPEDVIKIEKVPGEVGETVQFSDVLMLGGDKPEVGTPMISGASVAAEVLDQGRASKIIVFKKKRRKNYRRTKGHRQELTTVRVTEILTGGKAPSKTAAKKPAAKKAEPKAKAESKTEAKTPAAKKPAAKKAEPKTETKKAAPKKAAEKKPAAKKPAAKKDTDKS